MHPLRFEFVALSFRLQMIKESQTKKEYSTKMAQIEEGNDLRR